MLIMCLHRIRPDSIIDTFKLMTEIKKINLKMNNYNLTDMIDKIFEKREILLEMDNTCYPLNIFVNNMFASMSEESPESFQKGVDTEKTK